ncbi:hypothetical protein Tco_1439703 [Tanacetum coccineum]
MRENLSLARGNEQVIITQMGLSCIYIANGELQSIQLSIGSSASSQDQTIIVKTTRNTLIAASVPKLYGLSMHHVMAMKHWLVQKQTVFGKDKSIPLMVDSLPKTNMVINSPVFCNKELTIPEQTATDVAVLLQRHVADKDGKLKMLIKMESV